MEERITKREEEKAELENEEQLQRIEKSKKEEEAKIWAGGPLQGHKEGHQKRRDKKSLSVESAAHSTCGTKGAHHAKIVEANKKPKKLSWAERRTRGQREEKRVECARMKWVRWRTRALEADQTPPKARR
jgi:hypothetical protein